MTKVLSIPGGKSFAVIPGVGARSLEAAAVAAFGESVTVSYCDSVSPECVVLLRDPVERYAALAAALNLSDDELLAGVSGTTANAQLLRPYSALGISVAKLYRRDQITAASEWLGLGDVRLLHWDYDAAVASQYLRESLERLVQDDIALWGSLRRP